MKNIVFVIESLHVGGAEKSLVTLLNNLDYKAYNIDLILFKETGIFKDYVPKEVHCIQLEFPKLSFLNRVKYALDRKLKKNQHNAQLFWTVIQHKFENIDKEYDIAIAYNQGFATYFVNKYINASLKYAWLNTDYKKAGYNIIVDYPIYKNFNSIVAVSPEAKQSLELELLNIGKKLPITIIKDITDKKIVQEQANCIQKIEFNSNTVNILTVGRLVAYKGLELAINVCKILITKGYPVKWYVVGEGNEREKLEQLIKEKTLENHFFLIGDDPNPYPYMKNATIYVQTSLFEGLGLTVIEASYLNKPIVSTNFPSIYGIIKDEETGLIAEMNSDSIVTKIELLINNKQLKNKLIANLSKLKNKDKELTLQKINLLLS